MKNALIAEFIGTFFLYLLIGMCVTPPAAAGVAVAAYEIMVMYFFLSVFQQFI